MPHEIIIQAETIVVEDIWIKLNCGCGSRSMIFSQSSHWQCCQLNGMVVPLMTNPINLFYFLLGLMI